MSIQRMNVMDLSHFFLSGNFTIYEMEKITGISPSDLLKAFRVDLFAINPEMAARVNRILDTPGYNMAGRKYLRQMAG